MNRTSVALSYLDPTPPGPELLQKYRIKTDADFQREMPSFAVEPRFKVKLFTTEPLFDHFQYRLARSEGWRDCSGSQFDWIATEGANRLEVRAVNQLNRPGPPTFLDLEYR